MIVAELQGKIPSNWEDKEDILTSNVFSFFKYSDRQILKEYLKILGIEVSLFEAKNAEFSFWFSYDDGTEPDLIIYCGKYYLLFEAKLYSDFSPKTATSASQIEREIRMGKLAANNFNKEFVYVAITAEYYKNKHKYSKYENRDFKFIWTNWQTVANFLSQNLEKNEKSEDSIFITDLYSLLIKKKLRSFNGINNLQYFSDFRKIESIFYNVKTSKFKGEFSGFIEILSEFEKIKPIPENFKKTFFQKLQPYKFSNTEKIFYHGN